MTEPGILLLLRHGESTWNATDRFAGWVDVPLSARGRIEARRCGELLRETSVLPDVVHTSLLRRAIATADLALDAAERHWIPVQRSWRLNERHYGALQGRNREQVRAEYGADLLARWRRSLHGTPPPISPGSVYGQENDARYRELGVPVPRAESIADVLDRLRPYWESEITTDLHAGRTVLVVAHGNVLRALIGHLDGHGDDLSGVRLPTGIPMRYDRIAGLRPVRHGDVGPSAHI
ncbi:phosphoglyceromutase [Frankia sp. R43]|uniref:2,3-bisphosphoglycerate-dependent phosphoglycerate mutase n=1 Tax=Frankia sp. R43 TaxID=269536 RepID=UPI0006CA2937|nr:2,3-bisphosphoglycerate-dependent phosphoglycerate mutase [Frankia sp. R43]KPM54403.1 phosphoglyceromutase [Frankia sp. R43]